MMNRLASLALAATICIPAGALAQASTTVGYEQTYQNYSRLDNGMVVPNRWWSPNYVIGDWSGYGLTQPSQGYRWIRYYNDALLIDEQGRVIDSRYGMDWGRFGSAWSYDADGVPVLISGGGQAYAEHHAPGVTTKRYYHPGYAQGGYAYPAHGYGYGHAGYYGAAYSGAWVTETTVTYSDCCCEEEAVYEQPQPVYTPPPPPSPGERG